MEIENNSNIKRLINSNDIVQRSQEWFKLREGVISASRIATLL